MAVIHLLPLLSACNIQTRTVRHDHVVAAVGGGLEHGLVLPHEDTGDAGGETAESWGRWGGGSGGEDFVRCGGGDGVPYS